MQGLFKSLVAIGLPFCFAASAQFTQQGPKLAGSNAMPSSGGFVDQGVSVSVSADGDTALVGGSQDNGWLGAAWVFTRSEGVWTQEGKLVGSGVIQVPFGGVFLGSSVSLSADGNTALIGGTGDNNNAGAAWVFTRSGGVWTQQGSKLVGSGAIPIVEGAVLQGISVSLSADGNTALVGGSADNNYVGAAWVFTRSDGAWSQQGAKLVGSGAIRQAFQGSSVSLSRDGNTALVGGYGDNSNIGAAWVFTRSGGVWSQQGNKLVGTPGNARGGQGISVSLSADGNTTLIGGNGDQPTVAAAWVFTRSGSVWTQQGGRLVGSDGIPIGSLGGVSVSLSADGNKALLGGAGDNNEVGAAWVFARSGGLWSQQGSKLIGTGATGTRSPRQGTAVSLSADGYVALVGGLADNDFLGATWVFVAPQPSSTALSASANPSVFGQAIAFTATVTAGATGTITFSVDGVPQPPVVLHGSQAQLTIANLPAGSHAIGASCSGDIAYFASTSSVLTQTVNRSPVTLTLTSSANPSAYGQRVLFTATVSAGATGTATFTVDGVAQAPVALTGSQAQLTLANLSVGNHTISVGYSGDSNYLASTNNVLTQTVDRSPVTLTLTSSANTSANGQTVTFTATVSAGATGTVTFTVDGAAQAPVALNGTQAQLTLANLSEGNHTISAAYGGDSSFLGSTSNVLSQFVNPPQTPATLSLTSSTNPSTVGQAVTFIASLSGGEGVFSGTVQFFDGLISFGSAPVSGGQASLTTSTLKSGSHAIVAKYSGDASAQASLGQVVNGIASTTTVSANPAAILYGQAVVVTAQVGPVPPAGLAAPSGQVTFQDNGNPVGVALLSSGTATLTLNTLAVGTHQVTAVYGGDKIWSSSFARVTVTVALPALRLTNAAADRSTSFAPDEAVGLAQLYGVNTGAESLPHRQGHFAPGRIASNVLLASDADGSSASAIPARFAQTVHNSRR
jgi:hypothetical protein